ATARTESSRPIGPLLLLALGLMLLAVSALALRTAHYTRGQISDVPEYQSYGESMTDGKLPYRDFWLEYPPGALPAFALPALAERAHLTSYTQAFSGLMWLCAAMALLAMTVTLGNTKASVAHASAAVVFLGLSPLVLGRLIVQRF